MNHKQPHSDGLPPGVGAGLKTCHLDDILAGSPAVAFFEVHAENYMVDGGPFHEHLAAIRERYALSVHGVGLSIGGASAPSKTHLQRLRRLLERHPPAQFSEHLAWSSHDTWHLNDLLPVIYNHTTCQRVCEHVHAVQDALGRRLLLENPSTYLQHEQNHLHETDFLCEVLSRTGCGLLLDVNNTYVSCVNRGERATKWLDRMLDMIPHEWIGEIHLAGHARDVDAAGDTLLIDHHGQPVDEAVWQLYAQVIARVGRPVPTLIEWDNNVPTWATLLQEVERAHQLQAQHSRQAVAT